MNQEIILKELDKIQDENIRKFTKVAISELPDYFFNCAASSTGKYHPQYALGDGGLVRHTIAAVRFAYHIFQLDQSKEEFSDREQDCVIAAILLHDGWKHGSGNSSFTVHEHPQVCADWILSCEKLKNIIPNEDVKIISSAIASHMGQWSTSKRSKTILETPNSKFQKLVHLCDYLASRKDIEVLFDEDQQGSMPSLESYVMPFGKHKGELLIEAFKSDKSYFQWLKDNTELRRPTKEFVEELLVAN